MSTDDHTGRTAVPAPGRVLPAAGPTAELVARLVDGLDLVVIMLDAVGVVCGWNTAAERLTGFPAAQAVGRRARHLLSTPDQQADAVLAAVTSGQRWSGELTLRTGDGRPLLLAVHAGGLDPDELPPAGGILLLAADVSDQRRTAADLALLGAAFGQSPVGIGVFDTGLRYLRANPALLGMVGVPETDMVGRRIDEVLPDVGGKAAAYMQAVLDTGQPVVGQELSGGARAHGGGTRDWNVSYYRLEEPDGTVSGVASLVSDVTESRRAKAQVAAASERLLLLSRASGLLSSSLDLSRTLSAVAELVVPAFADHFTVDLLDDDGGVRRMAVADRPDLAPPPGTWVPPGQLVTYRPEHPTTRALASGQAALVQVPPDGDLAQFGTARSADFVRRVGLRSVIVAPLVARGRVLGAVGFATAADGRVYTGSDLALAEEIAARAAAALDNARIFQREQEIALTLQRSLLPGVLPVVEGLESAACYLPGRGDTEVGGDWYDLIPLSAGRTAVVIGDVMGRGVRAAAVMGQLRAAVRAYAVMDLPPEEVLTHLDGLVRALDEVQIVTCAYAVYDPGSGRCWLANAGHPPPLVLRAANSQAVFHTAAGIPLGVGGVPYEQAEIDLAPGDVLVLYTDGLVERRDEDIDASLKRLADGLLPLPRDLPDVVAHALAATGRAEGSDDDVAVLAVRATARMPDGRVELVLPPAVCAPHRARVLVRETLGSWLPAGRRDSADIVDVAELLVSELVTNAVRHAGSDVLLRLRRGRTSLWVEVLDRNTVLPRPRRPDDDDEGGRGLALVQALAHRWGSRPTRTGKVVWFELLVT